MNAAETRASSAIADWTPLTVVSRSCTTAEIETFISDVSTTSTNIAIARRTASRRLPAGSAGMAVLAACASLMRDRPWISRSGVPLVGGASPSAFFFAARRRSHQTIAPTMTAAARMPNAIQPHCVLLLVD